MLERVHSAGRQAVRRPATGRFPTVPELVSLGLAVAVLIAANGMAGAAIGAVLVLVWLRLPVEYIVALGQVALVVFAAGQLTLTLLLAVEASLGLLLVGSLFGASRSLLPGIVWLFAFLTLGGGAWVAVYSSVALWQVAIALWLVASTVAYGLYRHQLVTLGLTDGEHYA